MSFVLTTRVPHFAVLFCNNNSNYECDCLLLCFYFCYFDRGGGLVLCGAGGTWLHELCCLYSCQWIIRILFIANWQVVWSGASLVCTDHAMLIMIGTVARLRDYPKIYLKINYHLHDDNSDILCLTCLLGTRSS